jgi:hypothetical protein
MDHTTTIKGAATTRPNKAVRPSRGERRHNHHTISALTNNHSMAPVRETEQAKPAASRFRLTTTKHHALAERAFVWLCAKVHPNKATKPRPMSDANWLRWRKLANASPLWGWFTQGESSVAKPKYCKTPSTLLTKAANNTAAVKQFNNCAFNAARRPTAHISHTHIKDANSPVVSARSTTAGTQIREAMSQTVMTVHHQRSLLDQGVLTKGMSTTRSKAHAASIQLNNNGITDVEGLLANGFSQGNATHAANNPKVQNWLC